MIMRSWIVLSLLLSWNAYSQSNSPKQAEAEYYLTAYANHYGIPLDFARAVVEQESGWHICAISKKGAAGIMQLMPQTAVRLGVRNRCNLEQNISGGIRYLAWLMNKFHGELRLVPNRAEAETIPRPISCFCPTEGVGAEEQGSEVCAVRLVEGLELRSGKRRLTD